MLFLCMGDVILIIAKQAKSPGGGMKGLGLFKKTKRKRVF